MTLSCPPCCVTNRRPSGANSIAVGFSRPDTYKASCSPGGRPSAATTGLVKPHRTRSATEAVRKSERARRVVVCTGGIAMPAQAQNSNHRADQGHLGTWPGCEGRLTCNRVVPATRLVRRGRLVRDGDETKETCETCDPAVHVVGRLAAVRRRSGGNAWQGHVERRDRLRRWHSARDLHARGAASRFREADRLWTSHTSRRDL